ncbi:response regulator [Stieleria marina]|uniref:Translational regulator CsrA n=1 Tax=Stieleria marina TaxID=1930275 RepID=A0A517NWU0_9BACT|nr:Transcriptional regulatory protein SrrA [Planctomycetes bacterium K23_9]
MLVLSRRASETVEFPALGICVEVLRCSSKTVRIGINAPRDIQVLRGEISQQNPAASYRRFQTLVPPTPTLAEMSAQLRAQFMDAAGTLNQLQALTQENGCPAQEAVVGELIGRLKEIDSHTKKLEGGPSSDAQLRALLVDDNDNEARLLASYLKIRGFEVTTASNGQEALSKMSFCDPDVVLLDMTMPEFDGRWTIGQIRETNRLDDLTVFAVSGIGEAESDVEVGPNGVNAWFQKPLNPEELATAIQSNCRTVAA